MPDFNRKAASLRAGRRRTVMESRAAAERMEDAAAEAAGLSCYLSRTRGVVFREKPDLAGVSLGVRVDADGAVVVSLFRSRTDSGWSPVTALPEADLAVIRAVIHMAGAALDRLAPQDPITNIVTVMEAANDYV